MIEGHTDNIPIKTAQFKDNWDLSVARATNIVRMLDEVHQVDAKNLTAAGRGEYMPKASNETAEGRAKNRRTEIILSPKLDELYKLINKNK
jgi:chemotaxis protein MotB